MFKVFLSKRFKKGFTLTELLIVMAILIIMATILVGILNPIALVGKANDAERKRDLDIIKKTFEEYYNDNDEYPIEIEDWNIKPNCNKNLVNDFKYLYPWPCDPSGEPYIIMVSGDGDSFRILVNLENRNDSAIPDDWYDDPLYQVGGGYGPEEVNYGVSSSNVDWFEYFLSDNCLDSCFTKPPGSICNSVSVGVGCSGLNCYRHNDCISECRVACCGAGCN